MNSLLERMAAAMDQAGLADGEEGKRALALLEWPRVTDQVAGFCLNRHAAEQVRQRRPYRDISVLELWWQLSDELRPAGEAGRWPPLVDVSAGLELLSAHSGAGRSGGDLVQLAQLAVDLDALHDHLCRARVHCPTWGQAAAELATFATLTAEIRHALDRDGRVVDAASSTLARLRRSCANLEKTVRRSVEQVMREAHHCGWTTASEVALRDDRYCLPLRSGSRRKVDGIVHARSASGNTLFVEPAAVVHLHNELVELRLEAVAEEQRILWELSQLLEQVAPAMREACRFLLLVDQVRAGLLWSKKYEGHRPRLVPGGRLRICQGRHPLLLQYGPGGLVPDSVPSPRDDGCSPSTQGVVPLDLEVPDGKRVVVLSGPNAGGKSVALKTVGVCVLLAQCGWDVPAREDTELPLVRQLFVDLGDEQSIEKSLSSFSAHLGHLVCFLDQADAASLVLCDEIGSGTDPHEGTALAFTVLERLADKGVLMLASTHFGLLKAAVHDHPAMVNAAMDYDEESFQPLFTFRSGVPGSSHAFDIAGRWGFPPELLERARALVGEERFQIERLLDELGRRAHDMAAAEQELKARTASQRAKERDLQEKLSDFERRREELLAEICHQGEALLREGRRDIEKSVREIRSRGGDDLVIKKARETLNGLGERLPPPPASQPPALQPGQLIHIPHLGLRGRIEEVRGDKVIAQAEGMRLVLGRDACTRDETGGREGEDVSAGVGREASWRWHDLPPEVQHEIDLRGLRADEAWQQLDRLIDRAIPAGLTEILVIHGIGSGRLRDHLHTQLADDHRVGTFREAEARRGGYGATVVTLAEG